MVRILKELSCLVHGKPIKRSSCRQCNAAYMRGYLRRRRLRTPGKALCDRAKQRARLQSLDFDLEASKLTVPESCPALGIPLRLGSERSPASPSLDRIVPSDGYVHSNVRVISDRANKIKGNRDLVELYTKAEKGPTALRDEYRRVAEYVSRERLLEEVLRKSTIGGRAGEEWLKIATFLHRVLRDSRSVPACHTVAGGQH